MDSTRERERKKEREKGRKKGREHSIFLLFVMVFCVFDNMVDDTNDLSWEQFLSPFVRDDVVVAEMYAANAHPYLMEACGHPTRRRGGTGR